MPTLPEIFGTILGWITATGVISGLGLFLKTQIDQRKLQIDMGKLSIEDREALRTGYAATVAALTKDCGDLRSELARTRREADDDRADCHKVTDALRTIVIALREEIAGLRMNAMAKDAAAIRGGLIVPPNNISPEMQRALTVIDEVTGDRYQQNEERRESDQRTK